MLSTTPALQPSRSGFRGFTLIEMMVSFVVLAILCLGLMSAFVGASASTEATVEETVANNAAQHKIEEVIGKAKLYCDPLNGYPQGGVQGQPTGTFLDAMINFYQQSANCDFNVRELRDQQGTTTAQVVQELTPPPGENFCGQVILYLDEGRVPEEFGATGCSMQPDPDTPGTNRSYGTLQLDRSSGSVVNKATAVLIGNTYSYDVDLVPVEIRLRWKTGSAVNAPTLETRHFTLVARTLR